MKSKLILPALVLAVALVVRYSSSVLAQGPLTPPGAPGPTMKTLNQVEPRIDLQNAPASAVTTTNANYHYIITQAGSYYLSANLGVTKLNGIQINAAGVTLDLSGFEISRASSGGGNGIDITETSHRASVRNGSIKGGFNRGIDSLVSGGRADGGSFRDLGVSGCIDDGMVTPDGAVLDGCRAQGNLGDGISAGVGSTLINCTAARNGGFSGIFAADGSTLTNCAAYQNTGAYGIWANPNCALMNCTAYRNTSSMTFSAGIRAESGSSVTNCSSYGNVTTGTATRSTGAGFTLGFETTISGCTASANTGDGIQTSAFSTVRDCTSADSVVGNGILVGEGSTVSRCTVSGNRLNGVEAGGGSSIMDNTCRQNGRATPTASGIYTAGNGSRIEGNTVTLNGFGIALNTGTHSNLVVRNHAAANTPGGNYSFPAAVGNFNGTIITSSPAMNDAVNSLGNTTIP